MKKILLTGITGNIGRGISQKFEELFHQGDYIEVLEHITPPRIQNYSSFNIKIIRELGKDYHISIHLAANSDIHFCENPLNWDEVVRQNVELTRRVCECSEKVIFLSTDYVFNGRLSVGESWKENDARNPVNAYGKSKSIAEDIVLSHNGIVLRIETMMGVKNKIIDQAKNALNGREYFPFWTNNFIRPSYFPDFFKVLRKLIDKDGPAIYHVSCNGDALSRSEMANIVLDVYKEKEWQRALDYLESEEAKETKRFVLDTKKTKSDLGIDFNDAREAIRQHVLEKI